MEIIIANTNHNPSDDELLDLYARYCARHLRAAEKGGDTFDIDCTIFDQEAELIRRGIALPGGRSFLDPTKTCDICNQPILPDEKFHDDGDEIVHTTCVSQWFRGNFGREDLR